MAIFSIYSIANVVSFCLAACIVAVNSEESEIRKLPYCGPEKTFAEKLVFVSTLDGRLTALNAAAGGALSWSIETGPGPMLSSSIHRLELTNNGQWVRMIPSLSGGIYKFNGTSIEPIPVSADILLKSAPFTFSSDLAMSGGKETRTYGVIAGTGQVVYECSMDGCTNSTENYAAEDVVVVQRQTQTVRAIEARNGIERWNFSVGQHNLNVFSDSYSDCHGEKTPTSLPDDFELKVIVPEGLICSVNRKSGEIIWKHKFEAPVVAAWQLHQGEMFPIDLFSGAQWSPSYNDELGPMTPTLYIGMHNRQLYIQESVTLHERMDKMSTALMTASFPSVPQIPWAPVPATALAFVGTGEKMSDSTELGSTEVTTIARSFLYASEYVNGNGYYLFSSPNLKCQVDDKGNNTIQHDQDDDQSTEHKHGAPSTSGNYLLVNNLFYFTNWWAEIIIIIASTVVLVNLLKSERFMVFMNRFPFAQRFMRYVNLLPYTNQEVLQQHVLRAESTVFRLREHEHILPHRSNSEPSPQISNEFYSRYLNDFDPVHCLGKGGFGVVFEAKNKIDDCHYAVKRIPLPNRQESRDRVMREVKALAKLDHQNIVRYFNAWLECPPTGWQEKQDKLVPNCDAFSSMIEPASIDYSSHAGNVTLSKASTPQKCNSVYLNLGSESESESLSKSRQLPRYNTDKSDSFIVFEDSGGKESELNVDDCGIDDDDVDDHDDDETVDDDSGADMTEHNTEIKSCIKKAREKCMLPWEAIVKRKRTSSTTECHSEKKKLGHRRPKSLDITSGGGIILPKVSRVYLFIQMQLCRRESLREWLRDNVSNRDTNEVLRIFEQIVQAVEYVHLQGLIHRDLKPSNIFFSPSGEIKVGDFGLVTAMVENSAGQRTPIPNPNYVLNADETHTARVGTQLYMSPEQALGLPYNYKVDIYSLGVILFELLVPFETGMERSCVLMDLKNNKFPQHFQENFKQEYELLQLMLSHSPDKRPTTYGIRARPPLNQCTNLPNTEDQWHFELPPLKRELSKTSSVSTNSNSESWEAV